LLVSLKSVGVIASLRLPSSGAFSRSFLQAAIRSITRGIFRKSEAGTPTSHKHQRFLLFINSAAPIKRLIYFSDSGSDFINSDKSSFSIIKCPPSAGLLPVIMLGTLQIGSLLLSIKILGASIKYGLIFLAMILSSPSKMIFSPLLITLKPTITQ
jgi:hypothetical protein